MVFARSSRPTKPGNDSMSPAKDRMSELFLESSPNIYIIFTSDFPLRIARDRITHYYARVVRRRIGFMPEPPSTPDQNRSALQLLRRLWPFLAPFRAQLACLAVVVLFSIPLNLTTPLPLTLAVDSVIGDRPLPHLLQSWLPPDVRS